mmetsp:Transcript_33878/g.89675  ORF Transcript_33878/g.89675 Transcript_33878/m.89675 type:complete len:277 (+) Transcript_33878:100-930(+)
MLVIAARSEQRGEETIRKLEEAVRKENGTITTTMKAIKCDLTSLAEVREFAIKVSEITSKVDLLVLNAGAVEQSMFSRTNSTSPDGIESVFMVNYVTSWYLYNHLLPLLKAAAKPRVVVTSGQLYKSATLPDGDLKPLATPGSFHCMKALSYAALAKVLFAQQAHRLHAAHGLVVNSLHPGSILETGFGRSQSSLAAWASAWVVGPLMWLMGVRNTVSEGGNALLIASEADEGGRYLCVAHWTPLAKQALDADAADRLWAFTRDLVAQRAPLPPGV